MLKKFLHKIRYNHNNNRIKKIKNKIINKINNKSSKNLYKCLKNKKSLMKK